MLGFFVIRVSELLDYTADELTGKNLYTLCHGEDANRLRKSHMDRKYHSLRYKYVPSCKRNKFDFRLVRDVSNMKKAILPGRIRASARENKFYSHNAVVEPARQSDARKMKYESGIANQGPESRILKLTLDKSKAFLMLKIL